MTALSEGVHGRGRWAQARNAFGGAHGGAYASLLDCAAYWALYCCSTRTKALQSI
ncbi:MAG: hypothetical protein ACLTMP_05855 [Eggerthella lenta]